MRETLAVLSALGSYVGTVLPRARRELRRSGPLPEDKVKNAEAVALIASLAPRRSRARVVKAIVALQVEIDLRDTLEEAGSEPNPGAAAALLDLEARWRREVATLPAHDAVLPHLSRAIERCRQGQLHTHLAAETGPEPLERWARRIESPPGYRWWEVAAGASSSVAAHALIAAAADPGTTAEQAVAIDAAYQPPIGALTVFLDDLVDRAEDHATGEHNYLDHYESSAEAAERLALLASRAELLIAPLPRADRHRAILAGVAAYYLSVAAAETPYARPIRRRLLGSLGSGARLLAMLIRVRRLGERKRPGQAGNSPGP